MHSWSPTCGGPIGPIWNSHWPIITSALVPEMCEAGLDAGGGVGLDDVTAPDLVGADAAVVRTLRAGEAALGPAERVAVLEERVLLLDAEHRLLVGVLLGRRRARGAGVGGVRGHVGEQHLAHDEDVVAAADRVRADEHRAEHAVGLLARGLVGARAVEAPDAGLVAVGDDLGLRAQQRRRLGAVDPDVLSACTNEGSLVGAARRPPKCGERVVRGVGPHPGRSCSQRAGFQRAVSRPVARL